MFSQDVIKYNADNVICIDGYSWGDLNTVKQELLKKPAIKMVSWGQTLPGANMNMTSDWKHKENKEMANQVVCDGKYLDIFQIELLEGRTFSVKYGSDAENKAIINPLTAESLGYKNPVGKTVRLHNEQYRIIGVTEDYLSVPPIFERMPVIMTKAGNKSNNLIIRVDPKQKQVAHNHIKETSNKANPNYPVDIKYYEDITA